MLFIISKKNWTEFVQSFTFQDEEATDNLHDYGGSWLSKLFYVNHFFVSGADEFDHVEEKLNKGEQRALGNKETVKFLDVVFYRNVGFVQHDRLFTVSKFHKTEIVSSW